MDHQELGTENDGAGISNPMTALDSGMVFSSLIYSIAEANLFSNLFDDLFLVWPLKLNVVVFSHDFALSVSSAQRQKKFLGI